MCLWLYCCCERAVFIVVLVSRLVVVVVVVTIQIAIHKAHAQCSCIGLALRIIKILVIPGLRGEYRLQTAKEQ
jgi:hypothetical protein